MRSPAPAASVQAIYERFRTLAAGMLRRQRPDHTLQATALANEAYLRLAKSERLRSMDQTACVHMAASAMRSVLVDHARRRNAAKRGGADARREPLDQVIASYEEHSGSLPDLDAALKALAAANPELARIVELRFFGQLTEEQTAQTLEISARSVRRGWQVARQWLYQRLQNEVSSDG